MFLSFVFHCLTLVSFASARLRVTVSKRYCGVQAGNDVTLQCSIDSNEGTYSVFWRKSQHGKIYSSTDSRINDKYSGSSPTNPSLTIHDSNEADSGDYRCVGTTDRGNRRSDWIRLYVTDVRVPKTTYSVLAGRTITLECSILPPKYLSNVHWTKEGGQAQVFSSVSPRNTKYSGSSYRMPSLTIRDTNVKDTGTYTCRGLKSTGKTYSRSPLNLTGSPITLTVYNPFAVTIKPSKENISKQIGDFLPERTCVSDDCRGKCEVVWTLPNGRKKKDNIFNKNISKDDTGKYTCTISNEAQSESISFYVTVN
ncbi:sialoadhesin-like, partial [Ylistrum balloti]|uniref:sialoadhesin-like n=1 Tax=Ylistrum balloti TaxID=509963 RepID=UPI002905D76A